MGCSASNLNNEQCVTRCKDRKHYIKLAVQHRHAFAAAHMAYIQSLKNTGAALRQFAAGDSNAKDTHSEKSGNIHLPSNFDDNTHDSPYLPPPLPHFLHESLQKTRPRFSKTVSMPPLRNHNPNLNLSPNHNPNPNPNPNPSLSPPGSVQEEEEEEEEEGHGDDAKPPPPLPPSDMQTPPPPPAPSKSPTLEYLEGVFPNDLGSIKALSSERHPEKHGSDANSDAALKMDQNEEKKSDEDGGGSSPSPLHFSEVLRLLDDEFLAACDGGKGVARLLEARKMHYHSNSANYSESLEHSSRVLRVMSWGRNPQVPLPDRERTVTEKDTHASTLDKLLAWEKKLHDEVKAGELIRIELERKAEQLKSQKKRSENPGIINKTKASVKTLRTRYLVEIQAVDAASVEVDNLRDQQLYSQLKDLVTKLIVMWKCMLECHQRQCDIIENMAPLDVSLMPRSTNKHHLENTLQLESEIKLWQENLEKLLNSQKDYMHAVYHWLKLHIIQIEIDEKDTPSSPQKMTTPPVYILCRAWRSSLDRIPGTLAIHALKAFSSLVHDLSNHQSEELRQKKRLESLKKDLEKKEQLLNAHEAKHKEKWGFEGIGVSDEAGQEGGGPHSSSLKERERMVKLLKDAVDSENLKYEQMCAKSGIMAVNSLEKGLPPVLKAMRDFADSVSQCYMELETIASMNGGAASVPRIAY